MYERSSRSANSPTNSLRSASLRPGQWRPRERLAISAKSKISLAIRRTAALRSARRASPLSEGFSSVLTTRSMEPRSCSVGGPAQAGAAASRATNPASNVCTSAKRVIPRPPRGERWVPTVGRSDLAEYVLGEQLLDVHRWLDLGQLAVRLDRPVGPAGIDP